MDDKNKSQQMELALIKKDIEYLKAQSNRLVSHIESEQRVSVGQGKLIDQIRLSIENQNQYLKMMIDSLQKAVDKHQSILLNNGKGLTYEVDRLKQKDILRKDQRAYVISVLSVIISVLGFIVGLIYDKT